MTLSMTQNPSKRKAAVIRYFLERLLKPALIVANSIGFRSFGISRTGRARFVQKCSKAPKLRKLMDYQWRFDIRHRGRRLVPGGYIPMHYIDECFYLDGNVPTGPTLWSDGDRGRGWTEHEATWKMV